MADELKASLLDDVKAPVERLRNYYNSEEGSQLIFEAADMLERLAANRVPKGMVLVPVGLVESAKALLDVESKHHTEFAYKQFLQGLIAAGEVKP